MIEAYVRPVDEEATAAARARHAQGVEYLNAIFGWTREDALLVAALKRVGTFRPGRPTRRRKAKAQRIARRANR